ncbi:MAG: hypothetical protein B7Y02_01815 [Rhodobacterales bacterium 17-64-5]|nr:MAG: hypothetical protein B7Y02_01815 [Rhodobacterales bacterium 17-64-5]
MLGLGSVAEACGEAEPCVVGDRQYLIKMPPGQEGEALVPALIFLHGYKGSAAGSMRWQALQDAAASVGAALIVPESKGDAWSMDNAPAGEGDGDASELAFFDAMKLDVTTRFPVDPDRMVVVGTSAGGMAAWMLACHRSASFAGFVPMAGTFWAPIPATCEGPVASIVHIHGDADKTVPLEGRPIGSTRQGSVPETLAMYRAYGAFGPATKVEVDDLRCEMQVNATGAVLNFCQFSGGHSFSPRHMVAAWKMLEDAGRL